MKNTETYTTRGSITAQEICGGISHSLSSYVK